jgi:hypothetical protein
VYAATVQRLGFFAAQSIIESPGALERRVNLTQQRDEVHTEGLEAYAR